MPPPSRLLNRLLRPGPCSEDPTASKPLLAVDIDGVVNLMGREEPHNLMVRFELIAGRMNCISLSAGDCLRVLAGHFDLVWATGWGRGECEALAELLSLGPIPHLSFGSEARFGSCDWKIEPLEAVARERPLAWVDDSFDERCREWARRREAPVLLVDTEPQRGLETSHAEALIDWARGVRGGPASTG